MSSDAQIIVKTPWWKVVEMTISVILGVMTLASFAMFILTQERILRKKSR